MSITGFIIGAVLAIIFFVVATALIAFSHSALVFGLIALLIWGAFTFGYSGGRSYFGGPRSGPRP
jgi:hypothetical protein